MLHIDDVPQSNLVKTFNTTSQFHDLRRFNTCLLLYFASKLNAGDGKCHETWFDVLFWSSGDQLKVPVRNLDSDEKYLKVQLENVVNFCDQSHQAGSLPFC